MKCPYCNSGMRCINQNGLWECDNCGKIEDEDYSHLKEENARQAEEIKQLREIIEDDSIADSCLFGVCTLDDAIAEAIGNYRAELLARAGEIVKCECEIFGKKEPEVKGCRDRKQQP